MILYHPNQVSSLSKLLQCNVIHDITVCLVLVSFRAPCAGYRMTGSVEVFDGIMLVCACPCEHGGHRSLLRPASSPCTLFPCNSLSH